MRPAVAPPTVMHRGAGDPDQDEQEHGEHEARAHRHDVARRERRVTRSIAIRRTGRGPRAHALAVGV